MAHFSVAVFVRNPYNVDRVMEPFCIDDDRYYERILYMTREDYIRMYRRNHPDTTYNDDDIWYTAPAEYDHVDLEEGIIYDYFNPNGSWDYYDVGGRWRQSLCVSKHADAIGYNMPRRQNDDLTQRGKTRWVNGAPIKEVLWGKVNQASCGKLKNLTMEWDCAMAEEDNNYTKRRLLEVYSNKENYIMWNSLFTTHAFVCEDEGTWYDQDSYHKPEFLEKFYDIVHNPEYQDWWMVIVDCHI